MSNPIKKILANVVQSLSTTEKTTARDNIGAAAAADLNTESNRAKTAEVTTATTATRDGHHYIDFKNSQGTTLFSLNSDAFVKDGMVDTVSVVGSNLVITFNTDAGKQDISIPISDIFNADNYYTKTEVNTAIGNKVDKESGKGLSSNDYTTTDKTKLDGIAAGAEVNVQADWTETNSSSDAFIKNKPSIPTVPGVFSTSENGLVPAASGTGDTGKFLKGDGSWSDVPAPSVFNTTTDGLVPKASGVDDTSKYLKGDGTWDSPPTLPAATQDSIWSHLNGSDLWAPVTFGDYEIPYSLSPDIPDAYKNLYQQVEYIWSNDGGLINVNGLNFKSSDKFIINLYIKDIRGDQNWLVAGSQYANLTGSMGFGFAMNSAYHTGNCMYKVKFGSGDRQGSVLYKSGTTNPDKPELVRRQQVICKCPYLYANGDTVISDGVLDSKNMTCIRYVGTDSGLARWYAFGIMEVRDDNDNIIVKLVPCLNKSTGKYGVFCVQTSQFCGAWSGTIQEFIAP